jgi:hypothetical protein
MMTNVKCRETCVPFFFLFDESSNTSTTSMNHREGQITIFIIKNWTSQEIKTSIKYVIHIPVKIFVIRKMYSLIYFFFFCYERNKNTLEFHSFYIFCFQHTRHDNREEKNTQKRNYIDSFVLRFFFFSMKNRKWILFICWCLLLNLFTCLNLSNTFIIITN